MARVVTARSHSGSLRAAGVAFLAVVAVVVCVGAAAAATASVSPTSWNFGQQNVGTTSSSKRFVVANGGSGTLSVAGAAVSGPFVITSNSCKGKSLSEGQSCGVSVAFHPTSKGPASGTLTVSTDAGTPQAALSGTGTVPAASVSPSSLSFGELSVGATSSAKTVRLSSTGSGTLSISGISASGDFGRSTSCGSSLAAGSSCSIYVTFHPSAAGSRTGSLSIATNAGTEKVSLSGTGLAPTAKVSPTSLTFDRQRKGTISPARSVTLQNTGSAALGISAVSATGDFGVSDGCGTSLGAGRSCTVSVTFLPSATGTRTGKLSIATKDGTKTVALSGTGIFPAIRLDVKSLAFKRTVAVGNTSRAKAIRITNTGSDRLYIQKLSISGDFTQTNTCEPYVNVGITCAVSVTFVPQRAGAREGSVALVDDLGKHKISLSARATPAPPGVEPAPLPSPPALAGEQGTPVAAEGSRGSPRFVKYLAAAGALLVLAGIALLWFTRRRYDVSPREDERVLDVSPADPSPVEERADAGDGSPAREAGTGDDFDELIAMLEPLDAIDPAESWDEFAAARTDTVTANATVAAYDEDGAVDDVGRSEWILDPFLFDGSGR